MSTIEQDNKSPIAIVGMASLFAESANLNAYWDLIRNKIDAIIDVPASRWHIDDYFDTDKTAADKVYCRRGGFLPDIDFDPMEYGLPPNILELTDTSQLLSLVVAKDALVDAGLSDASAEQRNKIGVVLGVGGGQKINHSLNARLHYPVLKKVLLNSGVSEADATMVVEKFKSQYVHWEENSFPGSLGNVIAGRIANRFDLGGMNCVVDAACAGSLAATKMALSELWEGRADVMITGGVCTDNSPQMYMSFSKTPAFTENSVIQPFDKDSKGMMIGEGIGMVVLKRLADAERDGDRIYAVVKGTGTSSDGKFKSIYAPRPEGQAKALNRAYADAGFAPSTVGLIEAHGTGTAAGDVAEFEGLRQVFSQDNPVKQGIALGSVKSQIGHTKSTAGTAGFIKAALALHHKILPPTINVNEPNPKLNIAESPFYINSETRPWIKGEHPRRAGISSFGFGGTNYHVALEEYTSEHEQAYRLHRAGSSVLFSASDRQSLITELSQVVAQYQQGELQLGQLLAQYAVQPLASEQARLGLFIDVNQDVTAQLQQALTALQSQQGETWQQGNVFYRQQGTDVSGKVAALYSGQGSQYVNMGQSIAQNYPEYRNVLAEFDALLTSQGQASLSSKVMPIPVFNASDKKAQAAALQDTRYAQPAIGAFSWSLHKLMQQAGFNADFCAGHSFGELTALAASGVISEADYLQLCVARGSAMAATPADQDSGAMMAVVFKGQAGEELAANHQTLTDIVDANDKLWFANYNSPSQIVVAGTSQAIDEGLAQLKAKGIKAVKLPVSAAFHTPLVEFAQGPYAKAIEAVKFNPAKNVLSANSTGNNYPKSAAKIKQSYQQHMLSSVRFTDQIKDLYGQGARIFVEFGPKNILTRLVQEILPESDVICIALNGNSECSDKQLQLAHLQLAVLGAPLNPIDTYALAPKEKSSKAKSPLTIKLGGQNYLSEATQTKMQQALAQGQISQSEPKTIEVVKEVVKEVIKEVPVAAANQTASASVTTAAPVNASATTSITTSAINPIADAILAQQQALSQSMAQYQQQSMELQKQFLEQQAQLSHRLLDTLSGQAPVSTPAIAPSQIAPAIQPQETSSAAASVSASEPAFIAPEPKMPTAHPVNVPVAPVNSSAAAVTSSTPALTLAEIEQTMLNVVADKTGYPANMLELAMDMEADLGIDSIKRVEILGTVQDQLPSLPALNPEDLAELRTLGEIVSYMQAQSGDLAPASAVEAPVNASLDLATIQQTMLSVVADKTGYPANMLELGMDMEADLGIDSIKRVEILGTVQDQLPSLPALNPEDLAELRTLGEIVSYMQAQLGEVAAVSATADNGPTLDIATIEQTMLSVVADKTGYPANMLELGMDMEADLGIDSIKRVEILGTVQDQLPSLPALNPEDLAELRTLGEIVSYMQAQLGEVAIASTPSTANAGLDIATIEQTMLSVVADKTGYPANMLELSMDMEADLGIDSIKRVEILGTVQDQLPSLPALNPEDLAELRTLGEIVSYMQAKLPATLTQAIAVAPASSNDLDITTIEQTMLSVVADKTGYPANMLELTMDMEADLGIDSIKRVEILGSVQDQLPSLPALNPEDLAELRTLGDIVQYMQSQLSAEPQSQDMEEEQNIPFQYALMSEISAPKQAESAHQGEVILLTDDGHNTGRVAEKLLSKGFTPVVIAFPKETVKARSALNSKIERFTLADNSENSIRELCQQLTNQYDQVNGFVHLQPSDFVSVDFATPSKQVLQGVFLFAKHLKVQLAKGKGRFISVIRADGGLGYHTGMANKERMQMGLAGLCKTLKQEWPQSLCRVVDIDSAIEGSDFARLLVAEILDLDTQLCEVAVNRQGRFRLIPVSALEATSDNSQAHPVSADDVFLVSGGAKGVTNACVAALAKRSGAKFVLLGRSEPISIPQWAQGLSQANELQQAALAYCQQQGEKATPASLKKMIQPVLSQLEINAGMAAIEQAGGVVDYVAADVTDAEAMARVVEQTKMTFGAITGVIHGAGVLADGLIENKKLGDYERVFNTKIEGLSAILAALDLSQLKHIALFSSAAGFYGNKGQSDYAIANEILNKTALSLAETYPTTRVLSFNWGPWDGGMVTPELKRMFEQRGVYVIPIDGGANLFASQMVQGDLHQVQVIVGSDMNASAGEEIAVKKPQVQQANHTSGLLHVKPALGNVHTEHKAISVLRHAFVNDHQVAGHAVLPTVFATGWMAQAAQLWLRDHRVIEISDYQLFQGVILKNQDDMTLQLELTVLATSPQLKLQARISSQGQRTGQQQMRTVFHYGATLTLASKAESTAAPRTEFVGQWQIQADQASDDVANTWYQDGTLFHQHDFCGLKRCLHLDQRQGVFVAKIAPSRDGYFGDFSQADAEVTGSALLADDLLYQAMLVWAKYQLGKASLPVAAAKVHYYQRPAADQTLFVYLHEPQVQRSELVADVAIYDQQGQLLVKMEQGKVVLTDALGNQGNQAKQLATQGSQTS
ncbi:SDR family NAD(P)-dependent oxidoreductase [Motilimonas sp. KMU-193]|uniref:SDR family NAD(P)-dependent oxidoreductase n=1 Tax=Motilimonas sp. KMU-193 TaxID=3388668 RepID=UPI00396B1C65